MNLHNSIGDFNVLSNLTAQWLHLPESAIKRDYFIVLMLDNLAQSNYADKCVFKGGTSLSKCYPGSIERFSEDIDLTYLGMDEEDNTCEKELKKIIRIMTDSAHCEKIDGEGNKRNKSRNVWFDDEEYTVKLEIGCSVRPEPYGKRFIKTYIQDYLESKEMYNVISDFDLTQVELNTLAIERTFVDKIMSVKRHAICGTLPQKVRHIYDVVRLYKLSEIQQFINNANNFKHIIQLTKSTDSKYLEKREKYPNYNPVEEYNFDNWKDCFTDKEIKVAYESLHKNLLYTDVQQNFDEAIEVFDDINKRLNNIGE